MGTNLAHILVVGAGAAGLMAARELARAGKQVTILEARDRCGGRIYTLPAEEFAYPAEGGAEFIHGAAPITRALMREARLSLLPDAGSSWSTRSGALSLDNAPTPHVSRLRGALRDLKVDLPVAEFLETHFASRKYDDLRRRITRMVEGYDAADPRRFSSFALRDEWMSRGLGDHGRVREGYGALIKHLETACRRHGASIHLSAAVTAIETAGGRITTYCGALSTGCSGQSL